MSNDAIAVLKQAVEIQQLREMYEHFIIKLEEMQERVIAEGYEGLTDFCETQIQEMKSVLAELKREQGEQ